MKVQCASSAAWNAMLVECRAPRTVSTPLAPSGPQPLLCGRSMRDQFGQIRVGVDRTLSRLRTRPVDAHSQARSAGGRKVTSRRSIGRKARTGPRVIRNRRPNNRAAVRWLERQCSPAAIRIIHSTRSRPVIFSIFRYRVLTAAGVHLQEIDRRCGSHDESTVSGPIDTGPRAPARQACSPHRGGVWPVQEGEGASRSLF